MRRCEACAIRIEGDWTSCLLCGTALTGEASPSPFPHIPLRFSRRRVLKVLFGSSIGVILASIAVQLIFREWFEDIGVLRLVWLGVITMWLVVLMAVRKHRNFTKSTVYLVVIIGLFEVYWDYVTGWAGWSITWAVPIVLASAVLAVLILTQVTRIEPGEYIVYIGLTALLGLVPLVFLLFSWVTNPVPSLVCVLLSAATLVALLLARGSLIRHELAKRLDL